MEIFEFEHYIVTITTSLFKVADVLFDSKHCVAIPRDYLTDLSEDIDVEPELLAILIASIKIARYTQNEKDTCFKHISNQKLIEAIGFILPTMLENHHDIEEIIDVISNMNPSKLDEILTHPEDYTGEQIFF